MAKNNAIVEIQGTDLISESMHKINDNFKILAETEEQDRYKWQTYVDSVNSKIEELKSLVNSKNSVIEENIHTLADDIKNIPTIDNLQKQVTEAIENASDVVANVIATNAGDYISSALTGYVKTTSMNDELRKYVLSTGFEEYKSNADKKIATANRVVANSTFATTNDGYFIYRSSGEKSQYNSIESYYNAIKSEIDPTNKGKNDPDVYDTLLARCESTFKTVVNEITTIRQEVGNKTSYVSIIAAVKEGLSAEDTETDVEDIAASIFAQANETGSLIQLDADRLNFTGHNITLSSGEGTNDFRFQLSKNGLTVNTTNFKLDGSGNLTVKGTIEATGGSIGLIDINNSGLVCGNTHLDDEGITVYDGNDNVSIYIGRTSYPLMCGSDNANTALTKIDANGKLYAKSAEISGDITADRFLTTDEESITCIENNKTYSGELVKTVIIEDDNFNISSIGELTNTSDSSDKKTINASLCIKIMDVLPNENGNINDGNPFYGIPVLCMRYTDTNGNENEYTISPNSWMSTFGQVDNSNMRWIRKYSLLNSYSFTNSIGNVQQTKYVKGSIPTSAFVGGGTYYIFSPTNKSTFISGGSGSNDIYQLTIYGPVNESQKALLTSQTKPLTAFSSGTEPSSSSEVNQQYTGAFTYGSVIGSAYKDYIAGTETHINADNCNTFTSYLNYNIQGGVSLGYSNQISSLSSSGIDKKLHTYIKSILESSWWDDKSNSRRTIHISGLENNIPFSTGGTYLNQIYHKGYTINVNYYPLISIGNYGSSPNYSVTKMLMLCTASIYGNYDDEYQPSSSGSGGCSYDVYLDGETGDGGYFGIRSIDISISFYTYFNLSQAISNFSPDSNSIASMVSSFLQNYTNTNLYNKSTLTKERVSIEGTLIDLDRHQYTFRSPGN